MISAKKAKKILKKRYGSQITLTQKNQIITLEGALDHWSDIVEAGRLCADKKSRRYVVNNIQPKDNPIIPMKIPTFTDTTLEGTKPDVLIIGAGITGCSIARELSKWDLKVLLLDKEHDVALQTSSRNDGMVHPGIDLKKYQSKYHYNLLGNAMYDEICKDLDVDFKRTGQYLCFTNKWFKYLLPLITLHWKSMKIPVRVVYKSELHKLEPHLSSDIDSALFFPTAGIVCPYGLTIAYAENAVSNGVSLSLDTAVIDMKIENENISYVKTNRGTIFPKVVINSAGVFCEEIAKMASDHFFSIHPRKGTNLILDKKAAYQVNTIASLLGSSSVNKTHTKGGGLVSTIDHNLLVGPDAHETPLKEDYSTCVTSVYNTLAKQKLASPNLNGSDIITYFTGVRAPTYEEDFIIKEGFFTKNIIHAAGIQSPGLTAAPAIGVDVAKMAIAQLKRTQTVLPNTKFNPKRNSIPKTSTLTEEERQTLIANNPDYGVIICRCEEVSKGEIIDALNRPVPCDTVDGVKRRVRPGMGRCQGGFCSPLVAKLISDTKKISIEQVTKNGNGSFLTYGKTKEGE